MIEKVLQARPSFYTWIAFLGGIIALSGAFYAYHLAVGDIKGLSRDVTWGLHIGQFTYMVGIAAGAVMLVLPAYFHNYTKFRKIIILGEFLAVAACIVAMLFIFVHVGKPTRVLNVMLYPSPNSVLFWDMLVLFGYIFLNLLIGWIVLEAERHQVKPPQWIKIFIYIAIFWAVSIHTVTAFIFSGLPGRDYWLSGLLAAQFLASAFCSGPALLLLLIFVVQRLTGFDPGRDAVRTLTKIIAYAMGINIFFWLLDFFTAAYSGVPSLGYTKNIMLFGYQGQMIWINIWMWLAIVMAVVSFLLLAFPVTRDNEKLLPYTLIMLVFATWVDKGLGHIFGGFAPNPFGTLTLYTPSFGEIMISLGVYAIGALIVSILWKIALDVKKEAGTFSEPA